MKIESKKKELAEKMGREMKEKHEEHYRAGRTSLNWNESRSLMRKSNKNLARKGRESLNPAQKNKNDFEGQKSYKQEDT